MIYNTINLPFATLKNVSKPKPGEVKSLSDLYDFVVPLYDASNDKEFCIFYQADVNVEALKEYKQVDAINMVKDTIEKNLSNFSKNKSNSVRFSNKQRKPKTIEEVLKVVLYDQPIRKSVIGSHVVDQETVATVNLKLPRGTTLYISPLRDWSEQFHNKEAAGTVTIFGKETSFFIRKAHMNIMAYVSKELIQEEFSKAMKDAFSFFSCYSSSAQLPWEAKLEFK